ncbi:OsmC family protein [Prosthecochloris sp. N3]|uniref:OsmC family protein n=1 Tax=Prosthecochloris ethylica TaxID=2743976 RepID=A0ABR9XUE9_9CHLB|nr:OsmC family protein [Prosthecochloris ethylica]MBF0587271.1 OsmC family protein [Prosthecochloris ethylica]MBF0637507.1 OsmC family protein [Prosthecochloris ethylica]MEC9486922.1 OsmC family protein [Prosthecochloris sp.]NUK48079.1 OsmC family protein [Prosthecochloris ethylica]
MSTMVITSGGGKKVNAEYRGFTIETDQSERNGGEGSAPEPFMLFLASIGTCAGIYVYSFCQERGIPTDNIRILQKHEKRPEGKGIGKITIEIEVPADFPEKYRPVLIKSANLCAVKKHIQNAPEFDVVTTVAGE